MAVRLSRPAVPVKKMKRLQLILVAQFLAGVLAFAQAPLRFESWSEISDHALTPLGNAVLDAGSKTWIHAESDHFFYHGSSTDAVEAVAREAEYAYRQVGENLNLCAVDRKGHIFVVESQAVWEKVRRRMDTARYSLAMQLENDFFILKDASRSANALQVPHEMVHFRLWQCYRQRVPVWLSEGLAEYLGWSAAKAYHVAQGRGLFRTLPALTPKQLLPMDVLVKTDKYPRQQELNVALFREAEEMIRQIALKAGVKGLGVFLEAIVKDGKSWKVALRERLNYSDDEIRRLEEGVRQNCLKEERI